LKRFTVLESCSAEWLLDTGSYFAVEKGRDSEGVLQMRSVFNGRAMGDGWIPPPTVNIMSPAEVARKLAQTFRDSSCPGEMNILVLDLRHWFHQLHANDQLARHFGLVINRSKRRRLEERDDQPDRCFVFRPIPMGWKYSPWIAQTAAWGLLFAREITQPAVFREEALKGPQLPFFVETVGGGWATIYYDNMIIATPSSTEMNTIDARLEYFASKEKFNIAVKQGSKRRFGPGHGKLAAGFSFPGVRYTLVGATLRWEFEKREIWAERYVEFSPKTPRQLAEWTGRLIFNLLLSLRQLMSTKAGRVAAHAASEAGHVADRLGWDLRWRSTVLPFGRRGMRR
jgi:hypothetical protein